MKLPVIFVAFVAWLASCCSASSVRGLRRDNRIDVCVNLASSRYGSYGHQTVAVPQDFARWMTRRKQGCRRGPCNRDARLNRRRDSETVDVCRRFGGRFHGRWRTLNVPRFMVRWLEEHGASSGACKGRLFRGSTVKIRARPSEDDSDDSDDDDDNPLCMKVDGDLHTVQVSDRKYDWFRNEAEYDGGCDSSDETRIRRRESGDYCVRIQGKWYDVDTDVDRMWWRRNTQRFEDGSCDSEDIDDAGTISMFYDRGGSSTRGGGGNEYDDRYCVYEYGEDEYHTVDITYDPDEHSVSFMRQWFEDAVEDDGGYEGRCDADDEDITPTEKYREYCVKVDDEWCTAYTDLYWRDWWEYFADEVRNGECDGDSNDDCELSMTFN